MAVEVVEGELEARNRKSTLRRIIILKRTEPELCLRLLALWAAAV